MKRFFVFLLALMWAVQVQAQEQGGIFIQPLKCSLGKDCWIPNYVDLKGGQGVLDYMCGDASYDAQPGARHKGTDFAIRDMLAARRGVEVVAAAAGKVVGVRDGMVDEKFQPQSKGGPSHAVKGQECGNGVRLAHENGLFTQYCHLRQNSVMVKPGQQVQQGEVIGFVGLSGQTGFPHLHFQLSKGEEILDPFVGFARTATCGEGEKPLWTAETLADLPYKPSAIFNAGFAPKVPDRDAFLSGENRGYERGEFFPATAPVLLVWVEIFRVREGDRVVFSIQGPNGQNFHKQTVPIKARKAYQSLYTGKRLTAKSWTKGTYTARFELIRGQESTVLNRKMEIR